MNRIFCTTACLAALIATGSCQTEPAVMLPRAFRVTDRSQLFGGGPRALGEVGDYMIMNDRIRVVIQNAGYSRGFGVYGGSIIDADIRRLDEQGREGSPTAGGNDIFAEMFPSFFFQSVACDTVTVLTDGSQPYDEKIGSKQIHYDVGVAVIRASGGGGEFLTMLKVFDSLFLSYLLPTTTQSMDGFAELFRLGVLLGLDFPDFEAELNTVTNENAHYEIDYVLRPGSRHIELHARMINQTDKPLTIPSSVLGNSLFQKQLGGVDLSTAHVPVGTVMLYGRLNNVWLPGSGFDLRHPMERSFRRNLPLPAFNGIVTEFIGSASYHLGDRVSYGLAAAPSDNNFVNLNADAYRNLGKYKDPVTPIDNTSLLVPFTAISFIGVFSDSLKTTIQAGDSFEMVQNFIVGGGDVASIVDELHVIRGTTTGSYQGILRATQGGEPVSEGQLIIYQQLAATSADYVNEDDYLDGGLRPCGTGSPVPLCRPYSQDYPDDAGNLVGNLPVGRYAYRVQASGRQLGPFVPFEIKAGQGTFIDPILTPKSWIQAFVVDQAGRPIPAKVSVVGQYDQDYTNAQRRSGRVFDIQAGEDYRFTDMLSDDVPGQRAYIEAVAYTGADGHVAIPIRPGDYTVYFSRGFEYDLVPVPVHVDVGTASAATAKITRVVDTTGWMSMDGHVHSVNSIDSHMPLADRVNSAAGEGVEIAISTDHNYISDWRPTVDAQGLRPWLTSFVGIEFTTLESGHFNSYPLDYQVAPITHGAFPWPGHTPDELFAGLRQLADPDTGGSNIVVCNHPRDSTQGYFNQYGRSSLTGGMVSQGQSKRLAGPNGPAFYDENGLSTLSYNFDAIEIVNGKLAHEIHSVRVPPDWPSACYQPLPPDFDPKTQLDPCSLNGKVLRPASMTGALVPGTVLTDLTATASPGPSGIDNLEAVFPGAVDDWFHMLNQGYRKTGIAASDSHADVGEEPGAPRTFLYFGSDDPVAVTAAGLVDALKNQHAATLSHGPFLTFTVAQGVAATGGVRIGSELAAPDGAVTINYHLAAPPWVSVNRIQVYMNGRLIQKIKIDPNRNLADTAASADGTMGPVSGQISLTLKTDSWIVLEAVGDKPMFPVVTGTEEPFLLVSDAVGALAGPLGIAVTTDIGAVVVGNEQPYALTNPVWVRVQGGPMWQPPGVVPWSELNNPAVDPGVGVLRTRNHN